MPGAYDPLIVRLLSSTDREEDVLAMRALRRTPERGGVGAGTDATGAGCPEDMVNTSYVPRGETKRG